MKDNCHKPLFLSLGQLKTTPIKYQNPNNQIFFFFIHVYSNKDCRYLHISATLAAK